MNDRHLPMAGTGFGLQTRFDLLGICVIYGEPERCFHWGIRAKRIEGIS
jgi:hypothetical protein